MVILFTPIITRHVQMLLRALIRKSRYFTQFTVMTSYEQLPVTCCCSLTKAWDISRSLVYSIKYLLILLCFCLVVDKKSLNYWKQILWVCFSQFPSKVRTSKITSLWMHPFFCARLTFRIPIAVFFIRKTKTKSELGRLW